MKNRDISSLNCGKMNYFYRNLCRRPKIVNLASLTLCCCCLIYEFVCVCASIELLNLARKVKFTAFLVALSACAFKPTNPLAYVTRSGISTAVPPLMYYVYTPLILRYHFDAIFPCIHSPSLP